MVIGAFTLVQCEDIENSTVLYVQGNIECFMWWQTVTEVYIFLNIIPLLFVLSHAPFFVEDKKMSVRMFILSCLLPVPGMVIYHLQRFLKMKQVRKKQVRKLVPKLESEISSLSEHTVISEQDQAQISVTSNQEWYEKVDEFFRNMTRDDEASKRDELGQVCGSSDSDTDIGSEYSTDLIRVANKDSEGSDQLENLMNVTERTQLQDRKVKQPKIKFSNSREAIKYTLLKHYRTLTVFGFQFTWLGVHKLYRVGLVGCNTHITDPLKKLCTMSLMLLVITVANTLTKPYKARSTNTTAVLSYAANICIAVINLMKTIMITFDCKINCESYRGTVLWYLGKVEDVLLIYIPAFVVPLALLYMALKKCRGKSKEE